MLGAVTLVILFLSVSLPLSVSASGVRAVGDGPVLSRPVRGVYPPSPSGWLVDGDSYLAMVVWPAQAAAVSLVWGACPMPCDPTMTEQGWFLQKAYRVCFFFFLGSALPPWADQVSVWCREGSAV